MICQRGTCGHPKNLHLGSTAGCRINGCHCDRFLSKPMEESVEARRVCFDIPNGYMLSISLVPYTAMAEMDDEGGS